MFEVYFIIDNDASQAVTASFSTISARQLDAPVLQEALQVYGLDGTGNWTFSSLWSRIWNYCTLSPEDMALFVFDLYDEDISSNNRRARCRSSRALGARHRAERCARARISRWPTSCATCNPTTTARGRARGEAPRREHGRARRGGHPTIRGRGEATAIESLTRLQWHRADKAQPQLAPRDRPPGQSPQKIPMGGGDQAIKFWRGCIADRRKVRRRVEAREAARVDAQKISRNTRRRPARLRRPASNSGVST